MRTTIEDTQVELNLGTRDRFHRISPQFFSARIQPCTSRFRFQLHRKAVDLGGNHIQHYWMDKRGLYGDRKTNSNLHDTIIDCAWGIALRHKTAFHDSGIQESFILAKLLRFGRSNGARRVFLDSSIRPRINYQESPHLETLDSMLAQVYTNEISISEFQQRSGDVLTSINIEEQHSEIYEEITSEILSDALEVVAESGDEAVRIATEKWQAKLTSLGRRAGNHERKNILDIFSYECRAAFHRCYSLVWMELIRELKDNYGMTDASELFHIFWHLDLCRQVEGLEHESLHLFHGHIFGLHPSCSDFIQTATGKRLFSDLLCNPNNEKGYRRLINGILIAIYHYHGRHEDSNRNRRCA